MLFNNYIPNNIPYGDNDVNGDNDGDTHGDDNSDNDNYGNNGDNDDNDNYHDNEDDQKIMNV